MKNDHEISLLKDQISSLEKIVKKLFEDKGSLQEELDSSLESLKTKSANLTKLTVQHQKLKKVEQTQKEEIESLKAKLFALIKSSLENCLKETEAELLKFKPEKEFCGICETEFEGSVCPFSRYHSLICHSIAVKCKGKPFLLYKKWLVYQPTDPTDGRKPLIIAVRDNAKYRRLTKTERLDIEENRIRTEGVKAMTFQDFINLESSDPSMAIWLGTNDFLPIDV